MCRPLYILLAMVAAAPLSGCGWVPPPRLHSPGPAFFQRQQAAQFDPYPEEDVGPQVVGGRPQGFEEPPPEPLRARRVPQWMQWGPRPAY
jgi:hypothetical protein